mgnify:CR=1 FL=1
MCIRDRNTSVWENGNKVNDPPAPPTPPTDNKVIIITPAEDTPKTEDQKNPSTGANDFVGLAAAAAVVALLGSAVVLRKK